MDLFTLFSMNLLNIFALTKQKFSTFMNRYFLVSDMDVEGRDVTLKLVLQLLYLFGHYLNLRAGKQDPSPNFVSLMWNRNL